MAILVAAIINYRIAQHVVESTVIARQEDIASKAVNTVEIWLNQQMKILAATADSMLPKAVMTITDTSGRLAAIRRHAGAMQEALHRSFLDAVLDMPPEARGVILEAMLRRTQGMPAPFGPPERRPPPPPPIPS